jgi:hypothetical protein
MYCLCNSYQAALFSTAIVYSPPVALQQNVVVVFVFADRFYLPSTVECPDQQMRLLTKSNEGVKQEALLYIPPCRVFYKSPQDETC